MNLQEIESNLRNKVSKHISIHPEGLNRYKVSTPFLFDDGDNFVIVLKKIGSNWIITDEAHTFMHLSYDLDIDDIEKGTRQKIISTTLANFGLNEHNGEILIETDNDLLGDAFYSFVQGLIKITDIEYLKRERVSSTFLEDFRQFFRNNVPQEMVTFDYYYQDRDPDKKYVVDCRLNGMPRPTHIFAVQNDSKCRDVTITLLKFENWGIKSDSISIFRDQEETNRRVLARFSDVVDKQYSSLNTAKERIAKQLPDYFKHD